MSAISQLLEKLRARQIQEMNGARPCRDLVPAVERAQKRAKRVARSRTASQGKGTCHVSLVYTAHARSQMKLRNVTSAEIERLWRVGDTEPTNDGCNRHQVTGPLINDPTLRDLRGLVAIIATATPKTQGRAVVVTVFREARHTPRSHTPKSRPPQTRH